MTAPKPPSPKEALEYMLDCFRDGIGSTDNESEAIADAKAAIPVAELHKQAAEWLIREFEAQPFSFIKFLGEDKVRELAKILEALKAKEE